MFNFYVIYRSAVSGELNWIKGLFWGKQSCMKEFANENVEVVQVIRPLEVRRVKRGKYQELMFKYTREEIDCIRGIDE